MNRRKKVAVVGVGSLGRHHARIYAESPLADLVAVVDPDEERVNEVAARTGCRPLNDCRRLPDDVEAVSVAVPTVDHVPVALTLLRRGMDVLVEKPISHDLTESQHLLDAQRESGRRLHVGHSERFNPALLAARPYVGSPGFFETHRMGVFVRRSLDVDVVLDLMIHDIDLILSFVDSPISEIRAVGIPVLTPRVDIANVRIEFENGCVANLTASRVSATKIRKLRLFQPHDYISIDFSGLEVEMYSLAEVDGARQVIRRDLEIGTIEPLAAEISAFLEGRAEACSGEEAHRALEIAMAIKDEMKTKESRVES